MAEILLVRHTQSYANKGDLAFGRKESPLTPKGIEEAKLVGIRLEEEYGIVPGEYDSPVAASEYKRPQQTAEVAGFKLIDVVPLINESDVDEELFSGQDVVEKHYRERWAPGESRTRSGLFIDQVISGELPYKIYFSHCMFIASTLLECEVRKIKVEHPFDEGRGFAPLRGAVLKLSL